MGEYFLKRLKELEHHAVVGEVRGTGLWTAIDLTVDKETKAHFPWSGMDNLVLRGREKGVILKYMGRALEFAPPLTISRDQIDEGLEIVDECLGEEERAMGLA
jgi:4-aminobutyrate aminotransferase